jgi:hypothetical protein
MSFRWQRSNRVHPCAANPPSAKEAALLAQAEKDWSLRIERMTEDMRLLQVELYSTRKRATMYRDDLEKQYDKSADAEARATAAVKEKTELAASLANATFVSGPIGVADTTPRADAVAEIERNELLIREKAELRKQLETARSDLAKAASKAREDKRTIDDLKYKNNMLCCHVHPYLASRWRYD